MWSIWNHIGGRRRSVNRGWHQQRLVIHPLSVFSPSNDINDEKKTHLDGRSPVRRSDPGSPRNDRNVASPICISIRRTRIPQICMLKEKQIHLKFNYSFFIWLLWKLKFCEHASMRELVVGSSIWNYWSYYNGVSDEWNVEMFLIFDFCFFSFAKWKKVPSLLSIDYKHSHERLSPWTSLTNLYCSNNLFRHYRPDNRPLRRMIVRNKYNFRRRN